MVTAVSEIHGALVEHDPKSYSSRRAVALPAFLADLLREHLENAEPDTPVFCAVEGGPMRHNNWYSRTFKPIVKQVLPKHLHGVRFHDLRHTCAALLIAESAHPKAIQQRMGHSSITVTLDRYGHLLPSLDDTLSDALDRTWRTAQDARPSLPDPRPSLSGPQDGEHNMLGPEVVDPWSAEDGENEAEAESGPSPAETSSREPDSNRRPSLYKSVALTN